MKNIRVFLSENLQFLEVKFSTCLNRRVFEMLLFGNAYVLRLRVKSHSWAFEILVCIVLYLGTVLSK